MTESLDDATLWEFLRSRRTGDPVGRTVVSAQQLRVVELRSSGLSFPDIGRVLGVSSATARKHYTRAIENAQLELERRNGD